MRGLAAATVVLIHIYLYSFGRSRLMIVHGYLVVDLFFMMSGFVLTLAYQKRLDAGWSTGAFLRQRLIRLYPLYALGLMEGVLAARWLPTAEPLSAHVWWMRFLLAVFLLPALPGMAGGLQVFVFNNPSWSLLIEVLVNFVHAVFLRRRFRNAALLLMILSGSVLVWVLIRNMSVFVGQTTDTMFYGLPRGLFSYCYGMLLFRLWERGDLRPRIPPLLLGAALVGVLVAPPISVMKGAYDAIVLLIVFPWLLLAGASSELPERYIKATNFLGLTSFAVYILHEPLLLFWAPLMKHLRWQGATIGMAMGMLFLVIVFLFAWLADRFYDGPVRAWLQRKLVVGRGNAMPGA